ncbi:MAG: hypothetical protein HQL45_08745 [Alphaproteobacteria bacterium]|nr:hypothetical protein [Alphaproteobacteria bacterium]
MTQSKTNADPLHLGIGPHEGRECELMLRGLKPLAAFSDVTTHCHHFPEAEFAPHVAAGRIVTREETLALPDDKLAIRCLYYALPNEAWRIAAAHILKKALFLGQREPVESDDIALGRLLGYAEEDIQAFLHHTRKAKARRLG